MDILKILKPNHRQIFVSFEWKKILPVFFLLLISGVFLANPGNIMVFGLEGDFRVGFTPLVTMLSGILLGPLGGLLLGGFIDFFAVAIYYGLEEFIFGFTLLTMLRGFLAGYFYHHVFARLTFPGVIFPLGISYLVVSVLLNPLLLNSIFGIPYLENVLIRLQVMLVALPLYGVIAFFVLRAIWEKQELKRLNSELDRLWKTDALTGLASRRLLLDYLDKMISLSCRNSSPLAIIMVDVDDFKSINDTYGHSVGDEVLKLLGNLFQKETREEDMAARIGGEEFAILLPNSDQEMAWTTANRLKMEISRLKIPPVRGKITATFGVSRLNPGDEAKDFLARADRALYLGKKTGKNKIVRSFFPAAVLSSWQRNKDCHSSGQIKPAPPSLIRAWKVKV